MWATSQLSFNCRTPKASNMNCLWYSRTGGSTASAASNTNHRISIQLIAGRLASVIGVAVIAWGAALPLGRKRLRRERLHFSRRWFYELSESASASPANLSHRDGHVSVNGLSSGCPAAAAATDAMALAVAAEEERSAARAID